MAPLQVAVLGCGGIGAKHAAAAAALGEQMRLIACCGRNELTVAEFARKFGLIGYTDFERMLKEQRLDLLIVALPPYAHCDQVETAAAAGIHLLVEKPIALDMSRAESMVRAAQKAGIVAACGFMYRFGDAVRRWEAAAEAGETGRTGLFVGQFHCNSLHVDWWRERAKSGGQMVEQLIHIIDLARHQVGEPQTVYARASNFFHRDIERYDSDDTSGIVLGYNDGRLAVLNATNGAQPGRWEKSWQLVAERMTGQFSGWNAAVLSHTKPGRAAERIDTDTDVFIEQLADVARAISTGRAPTVPLDDGARTLRIALAAVRSSTERREILL
jgi:predicted dehydrogenase